MKKSPLKRTPFTAKRTPLKKVSAKGRIKREEKKELLKEDFEFYKRIWNTRVHVCYESGSYLGEELNICCFHHVLPKKKYPQYRHEDCNIVLLLPSIHNQVEMNINRCPKVKALTEELKEKYKN